MFDFVVGTDDFGKNLAEALGCEYRWFSQESYPDGEPYPRMMKGTDVADYEEFAGKNIVFAPRTSQKQTDQTVKSHLHYTERVLRALKDEETYNAAAVDLVLPYFLFARQDINPKIEKDEEKKKRDKGKDIGCKFAIETFRDAGARRIISVDPHFLRKKLLAGGSIEIYGMEIKSVSGVNALARYFQGRADAYGYVTSPDMGASALSLNLAAALGLSGSSLEKKRKSGSKVEIEGGYDAGGLDVIIADDIISTGKTVEKAVGSIDNAGEIIVACEHAVLPPVGYDRIVKMKEFGQISDIVATDTVNSDFSKTSVVPELVEALAK